MEVSNLIKCNVFDSQVKSDPRNLVEIAATELFHYPELFTFIFHRRPNNQ